MAAIHAAPVAPSSPPSAENDPQTVLGIPCPGLAANANLTARIVVDDGGGLGALLLAIENDLDSTTSSVAMFLNRLLRLLPCLSDTFFFVGCKKAPLLLGASRPWKWNPAITIIIRPEVAGEAKP